MIVDNLSITEFQNKSARSMSKKAEVESAVENVDFENKKYQIQLETSKGMIKLNLWSGKAPGHCKNMIGLSKIGYYDGLIFHRVISGFMIQGGCPKGSGTGGPGYNIDAEFNDAHHKSGVLSMARSTDPNSAGSQFFVCLEDSEFLNGQYTAFGETADEESLAVVKSIGAVATASDDRPNEDVVINKATVVEI